jgi:hypothetical protein
VFRQRGHERKKNIEKKMVGDPFGGREKMNRGVISVEQGDMGESMKKQYVNEGAVD